MPVQQTSQGGSHAEPTPPDSTFPFRSWTVSQVWIAVLGAALLEGGALGLSGRATPCLVIPIAALFSYAALLDRSTKVSMDVRQAVMFSPWVPWFPHLATWWQSGMPQNASTEYRPH